MKPYHKNPRKITPANLSKLKKYMVDLGDLGGIVHDLNSDEIISGNQRSTIMDVNNCKIEVSKTFDPPLEDGTVGLGWINWDGKEWNYRQVRWNEEQCEFGNLIANKANELAEYDADILIGEFSPDVLKESGFDVDFQLDGQRKGKNSPPEMEISPELFERHDYLVFYFDNEFDWQVVTELFDVKMVRCGKVGKKTVHQKGLGRVIPGTKLLELVNHGN